MTFAPTRERISLCPPDVAGDEILGPAIGTKDDVDNDLVEGSNFFAVVLFLKFESVKENYKLIKITKIFNILLKSKEFVIHN